MAKAEGFKNDEEKKESLLHNLEELKQSTGWKIILKYLERDMAELETKLYRENELNDGETDDDVRIARHQIKKLKELPDTIIEENTEKEGFDPDLDPYE